MIYLYRKIFLAGYLNVQCMLHEFHSEFGDGLFLESFTSMEIGKNKIEMKVFFAVILKTDPPS